MAPEERVLCFERKLLEELGLFQGLSLAVEKYLPVVTSSSRLVYLNRSEAELDKGYKQLIPIVEAVKDLSAYESWSRLCLENLDSLLSRAAPSGSSPRERLAESQLRPA